MEQHSLFEYWKLCWSKRFASFSGRARRREYWGFVLFNAIFFTPIIWLALAASSNGSSEGQAVGVMLLLLFSIVSLLPTLAVLSRRLHDAGFSAWWILIYFVPLGIVILFIFTCLDSEPRSNKWGHNPKEAPKEHRRREAEEEKYLRIAQEYLIERERQRWLEEERRREERYQRQGYASREQEEVRRQNQEMRRRYEEWQKEEEERKRFEAWQEEERWRERQTSANTRYSLEAGEIREYLRQNGVKYLYLFTARDHRKEIS